MWSGRIHKCNNILWLLLGNRDDTSWEDMYKTKWNRSVGLQIGFGMFSSISSFFWHFPQIRCRCQNWFNIGTAASRLQIYSLQSMSPSLPGSMFSYSHRLQQPCSSTNEWARYSMITQATAVWVMPRLGQDLVGRLFLQISTQSHCDTVVLSDQIRLDHIR
jgi:hypothetical protein